MPGPHVAISVYADYSGGYVAYVYDEKHDTYEGRYTAYYYPDAGTFLDVLQPTTTPTATCDFTYADGYNKREPSRWRRVLTYLGNVFS